MPDAQDFAPNHPLACPLLSLRNGPGITVSVDNFEPLSLTPRGNHYILLFTDRFSRRTDMYAVARAQVTAAGTADILIDQYKPLMGGDP